MLLFALMLLVCAKSYGDRVEPDRQEETGHDPRQLSYAPFECKSFFQDTWLAQNKRREAGYVPLLHMFWPPERIYSFTNKVEAAQCEPSSSIIGGGCQSCVRREDDGNAELAGSGVAVLLGDDLRPCVSALEKWVRPILVDCVLFVHTSADDDASRQIARQKISVLGNIGGYKISNGSVVPYEAHCYDCGSDYWWIQWYRLQQCFVLLEKYEREKNSLFSIIVRMRTDVFPHIRSSIAHELLSGRYSVSKEHVYVRGDYFMYGSNSAMKPLAGFIDGIRNADPTSRYNLCCPPAVPIDDSKDDGMPFNRLYYPTNWSALARSEICGMFLCQHAQLVRFPAAVISVGDDWRAKVPELLSHDDTLPSRQDAYMLPVVTSVPPLALDTADRFYSRGQNSEFLNFLIDKGVPFAESRFGVKEMVEVLSKEDTTSADWASTPMGRKHVCLTT